MNTQLWSKDIKTKPVYFCIDLDIGWRFGDSLRYFNVNKRSFMVIEDRDISVFNPKTSKVESNPDNKIAGIADFRLFGAQ